MRKVLSISFLAIIFAGFGLKLIKGEQLAQTDRGYIVAVGDKVPDITLLLTNGDKIQLSDLTGKVVMLQFTASWCGVCRKEMPFIEDEIWIKHKNRNDFALFAIDREEPKETVLQFINDTKITYPMALDSGAEIFKQFAYQQAGITRNVIIDKNGKIAYLTRLFNREEFNGMKDKILELLNE